MVSQITTGYPIDEHGRAYRRRRLLPGIIVGVILLVLGITVWLFALAESEAVGAPVDCNMPSAAAEDPAAPEGASDPAEGPNLTPVDRDEMLNTAPAALAAFQVRVLNASDQRGAARSVSEDLTAQGFNPAPDNPYGDDSVYATGTLDCVSQIRFGPGGREAAAALWIAMPCAQLIDDGRPGTVVDAVLGSYYESREQSQDAQAALDALRSADPQNTDSAVDPGLLRAVHDTTC